MYKQTCQCDFFMDGQIRTLERRKFQYGPSFAQILSWASSDRLMSGVGVLKYAAFVWDVRNCTN